MKVRGGGWEGVRGRRGSGMGGALRAEGEAVWHEAHHAHRVRGSRGQRVLWWEQRRSVQGRLNLNVGGHERSGCVRTGAGSDSIARARCAPRQAAGPRPERWPSPRARDGKDDGKVEV